MQKRAASSACGMQTEPSALTLLEAGDLKVAMQFGRQEAYLLCTASHPQAAGQSGRMRHTPPSQLGRKAKVATPSATHSVDCRTHCVDATEVNSGIVSTAAQSVHTWKAMLSCSSHDDCSDPRVTDRVQRASVNQGRHSAGGKDDHGTRRSARACS